MHWLTSRFDIDLSAPRVMGIVNVTPDSFSDGGRSAAQSIAHAEQLVRDGAHLLDIGGESTRPGAVRPPADAEWTRVEPVLRAAVSLGVPVSVDTSAATVIRRALDAGADIVNDVRALREPGALQAVAAHPRAGVCLMHLRGEPATMQHALPEGRDVVAEVQSFLRERLQEVVQHGVSVQRVVVDYGIGFGKSVRDNLDLLRRQRELLTLGVPLLVGWSRKSTLGALVDRPVDDRLAASVAAALAAVQRGARIVRVHDVRATVDALKVWQAAGLGQEG